MSTDVSFFLRPMYASDTAAVKALWADRFGEKASTQENWINAALSATHSVAGFVAMNQAEDEILGVSFLEVGDREYTEQYLGLDTLDVSVPLRDENGIFHLSCVRKAAEGCGIGSALYERRLRELEHRDVSHVVGIAWHRSDTVDSRVLFEKYDFTRHATIDDYYERVGQRPHCPDCGDTCTCTASLYCRNLVDESAARSDDLDAEHRPSPK